MSPLVRSLLCSDLTQRYGDYAGRDLVARSYFGTRHIVALESLVERLAAEVFGALYVELRPLSGHIAGNCLIMALCRPGDLILELGRHDGGHRLATKLAASPLINIEVDYLPFDASTFNVNVDQTLDLVRRRRPRLVIVGASNFLFPVPLQALSDGLKDFEETILIYDASHVLGLIAGKRFQDPLQEGALVVLAGTQKSFPGPQGGLIYTNSKSLIDQISQVVHPAMLSNHHLARLPSLGLALQEMRLWGAEYADQVIRNAQALAEALFEQHIPVVGDGQRYTASHTVLINTQTLGDNYALGQSLDEAGIIVTAARLPKVLGGAGLRLGVNEITRRGAVKSHMKQIASLIADVVLSRRDPDRLSREIAALSGRFEGYAYTWSMPQGQGGTAVL